MHAKVVLPDFRLPGQRPHIAVRALWIMGGLLVLSMLGLGGALWRRQTIDSAARLAAHRANVAARERAGAAPAAVAVSPVAAATDTVALAAAAPTAEQLSAAPASRAPRAHVRHRRAGARHGGNSMKGRTLARAADRSSKKPLAKKDDAAIDRLLRQFK
jgi:hypothetical protein